MSTATANPALLLDVENLVKHYRLPREQLGRAAPTVAALQGVSLQIQAGRSLGVVGESGSGKSTLARLVMALETPTHGRVRLLGRDLHALPAAQMRTARRDFQMIFQDPYGSLDPRQRVGRIVAEPLLGVRGSEPLLGVHGNESLLGVRGTDPRALVTAALDAVGLRASDAAKYPHEFSGGQRQRIAIARALITRPKLIVADEPVSALDVSVQAQVLNLLADLQQEFGLTYLFISHDLAVVDHVCDDVAVLYAGRVVEQGPAQQLFQAPAHPYTQALLAALPAMAAAGLAPQRGVGAVASATVPPREAARGAGGGGGIADGDGGCAYAGRCGHARTRCAVELPLLRELSGGQRVACHFAASPTSSTLSSAKFPGETR